MHYKTLAAAWAVLVCLTPACGRAQPLQIDLSAQIPAPMSGHLKVGGADPQGVRIDANSRYLTRDGKPWFPVMGEFHYARYPHAQWEEELLKMKAGGINIVSMYIFWIHHEEIEGEFDWSGDKDLRQFVQLCAKHGLYCYLRLGPWDHGEARNGGFPDWLLAKVPARQLRTTDPAFMGYTRTLYAEIFKQVNGLLYKDGGPIIGVQVENELRNNAPYLLALKNMAKDVGFDVPLYSMTGWGPAQVPQDELLPMFGGYADGFWIDGTATSYSSTIQFFFTHNPNDERLRKNARLTPTAVMAYLQRYPYLTCEIGGGMAIAYARRPLMPCADIASAALCKLGDGSCLMGYYMYHGGGNPPGKLSTLQESQATNYPNDLPIINYDFQAPLGQFGQERESYHALRLLHTFIGDFGSELCNMPSILPAQTPGDLDDQQTLRWAVRSDGHSGFIFINNHQRGISLPEKQAQFDLHLADGDQIIPAAPATIPSDSAMIWPFNLDLDGVRLRYATAQLLCKLEAGNTTYFVFFAPPGIDPVFDLDGNVVSHLKPGTDCTIDVRTNDGHTSRILLLTQDQARHAWKTNLWGADRLFISSADLIFDGPELDAQSPDPALSVSVLPAPAAGITLNGQPLTSQPDGIFTGYSCAAAPVPLVCQVDSIHPAGPARIIGLGSRKKPLPPTDGDFDAAAVWHISVPRETSAAVHDVYLKIDYVGDAARAYIGDRMIDDDFYYGRPWEIGLSRYGAAALEKGITLKILPFRGDSPVFIPNGRPATDADGQSLRLRSVEAHAQYQWVMQSSN